MKLLWNTERNHAIARSKIREFIIVDNTMDARTDLFVKTTNGGNVFLQSFASGDDARAFIEAALADVDPNADGAAEVNVDAVDAA